MDDAAYNRGLRVVWATTDSSFSDRQMCITGTIRYVGCGEIKDFLCLDSMYPWEIVEAEREH